MNPGPCIVCGATNYPNSLGGPAICPSCDCGNPPKHEHGTYFDEFRLLTAPAGDVYTKQTQIELLAVMIGNAKLSKEDLLQAWDLAQVKEIQES